VEEGIRGVNKSEQERSNEQEHWLYRNLGPPAQWVKIAVQMVIGLAIVVILAVKLSLHVCCTTDQGRTLSPSVENVLANILPTFLDESLISNILSSNVLSYFVESDPLTLIGSALVLSAGVELAYMLYTDHPDEALDPLILGLAAAALLVLHEIKDGTVSWQLALTLALTILVLSGAIGFLFYIRYSYAPTPSGQKPVKEELRRLEARLERAESALQTHLDSLERNTPPTARTEEPRSSEKSWWRRW
jgi:hypothetical protein